MELRMVSLDSKEILELQVPNSCPVGQLKQILCIHLSKGGSVSPDQLSLALSLRSDHLSLESLDAVTSGDVIFFSVNPRPAQSSSQKLKAILDFKVVGGSDSTMLMNVAVQLNAVLLDFGFVGFDPVLCTEVDGFRLPDRFPSAPILQYTTPRVLSSSKTLKSVQTVAIRFQRLGKKFINVFGSLSSKKKTNKKGVIYRLCLDGSRIALAIELICTNKGNQFHHSKLVSDLWKDVKDGIALPLLIDLCDKVGLVPPSSSFMLLPAELKLMVLKLLPGIDVKKVACVCKGLRSICKDNALWRHKLETEFGEASTNDSSKCTAWEYSFKLAWKIRQSRIRKKKMHMVRGYPDQAKRPRFQRCIQRPRNNPFEF